MNILARQWPTEGLTRIPYWLYTDRDLYAEEQERIFRRDTWTFLCLEAELPEPNTFRASNLGDMPVVVTRDDDGVIHAFENRCAHRGSLLCLKERGEAMVRGLAGAIAGYWARDLEGDIQHSIWLFDTLENAHAAASIFGKGPPSGAPATFVSLTVCEVVGRSH